MTHEYRSAGEILSPWMKELNERRQRMDNEGQEGGTLPGMEGGGAPIPEENTVRVMGRLTRSPFMTEVTGGHKKAWFTLAVTRTYRNGENQKKTEKAYVPITAWRAIADQAAPLGKDSAVLVEGRLKTWADKEGKRFHWEVEAVMFEVLERREPVKDVGRGASKKAAAAA